MPGATGHKIAIQYGSTGNFKRQIEAGEAFDLVIFGSDGVDDLIKQGKIAGDTRVDIARVGIGLATHEGAPKPDISSSWGRDLWTRAIDCCRSKVCVPGAGKWRPQ